jgi:uncharacterized protein with NRDE domain
MPPTRVDSEGLPSSTTSIGRLFGTRTASVVLVRDDGQVTFVERDIALQDGLNFRRGEGERRFDFEAQNEL